MRQRVATFVLTTAALAAALMLPAPSAGQGQGKGKGGPKAPSGPVTHKPIPRTPDGKPDLSGVWQAGGVSINGEAGAPPPAQREAAPAPLVAGNPALSALARQAAQHYDRAITAQRAGDWTTYGSEMRLVGDLLRRMSEPGGR